MSTRHRFAPRLEILEERWVPATLTVKNLLDDGSPGSLRGVIDAANATEAADTIVFRAGLEGTILLSSLNSLDISEDLTITGPGASKLAISGIHNQTIFRINAAEVLTVKMSGLELRNGKTSFDGGAIANGGDPFSSGANLTVRNMAFTGNQAANGGAISSSENLTVAKCTFSGNTATDNGGGIFASSATINDSRFSGNAANQGGAIHAFTATVTRSTIAGNFANGSGSTGGGIDCNTAVISRSTIAGNSADSGGGLHAAEATITNSTIASNRASLDGGGIFCQKVTMTGSTVSGNSANNGGGIRINTGVLNDIRNSTISGNRAIASGGGLYSSSIDLALRNCTIAFNQAGSKGGGIVLNNDGDPLLESCLVVDNVAGVSGSNLGRLGTTEAFLLDHCLIGAFLGGDTDFLNLGDTDFNVEARLAPLANNGGTTQTHALKKGSPAIDAGINSLGLTTDQRGKGFKRKFGAAVDVGAFERQ